MSNKNEVFEYLIDQLRQQVEHNPYEKQREDLAHEVQSLKNQLRDMSELVDELQSALQHQIDLAVYRGSTAHFDEKGKVFKVERRVKTEQSGCREEGVSLPVCQCAGTHCGTYNGNTVVCDNCGGGVTE